ncbi:hypothetical protein P389DRAFT_4685 [Cystobasidium minutum MCA 4210]|uniref:uncharacterized protein n=1 Tax=Cystobasidium minutum MCA 4210 TaxID=1397322 RepID=UPI0034CE7CBA|eukprot:jgi/Rhomi1/4685/CE4684_173
MLALLARVGQKRKLKEPDSGNAEQSTASSLQPLKSHSTMDIDKSTSAMGHAAGPSESACHRVVLTPELASLVFLHLDQPIHFNATCRLFRSIATNPAMVYAWFNMRFWKCELLYQLLKWKGCRSPYYTFFLDEKKVPVSRELVSNVLPTYNNTLRCRILSRFPHYTLSPYSANDAFDVTCAIFHTDNDSIPLQALNDNHRAPVDRAFLLNLFNTYGLPAYERNDLASLLAAILLVGSDLDWWAEVLRQSAGFPQLVPQNLLEHVLQYLIYTRHMPDWGRYLVAVDRTMLQGPTNPLPQTSVRLLE